MNSVLQSSLRISLLLAVILMLTGCFEKRHHPVIEVIDGEFVTPKGDFDVEKVRDIDPDKIPYIGGSQIGEETSSIFVMGNDRDTYITVGFLPQYSTSNLVSLKNRPYTLRIGEVIYTLNGEKMEASAWSSGKNGIVKDKLGKNRNVNSIFLGLPKPLAALDTTIQGGSLNTLTVNKIQKGENNVHRFIIPFSLDEDKYVIDVSFHVKLRSEWTLMVQSGGLP